MSKPSDFHALPPILEAFFTNLTEAQVEARWKVLTRRLGLNWRLQRVGTFRAPLSGPLEGILTEPLPWDYTDADLDARYDALFDRYGINHSSNRIYKDKPDDGGEEDSAWWFRVQAEETWGWKSLARALAVDFLACMWVSRPPGRPRKSDFTDDDARIFYELGKAEFERWLDKKRPTVNARARIVAKMLDEKKTPIRIKDRYHTLRKRSKDVLDAMMARGEELARARKTGARIKS